MPLLLCFFYCQRNIFYLKGPKKRYIVYLKEIRGIKNIPQISLGNLRYIFYTSDFLEIYMRFDISTPLLPKRCLNVERINSIGCVPIFAAVWRITFAPLSLDSLPNASTQRTNETINSIETKKDFSHFEENLWYLFFENKISQIFQKNLRYIFWKKIYHRFPWVIWGSLPYLFLYLSNKIYFSGSKKPLYALWSKRGVNFPYNSFQRIAFFLCLTP